MSHPEFHKSIRDEADALFANGNPERDEVTGPAIDVTRRFIMECMRLYPIVPASYRNVMNTCAVDEYELPEGARVIIAQTATHYMEDVFPDPSRSISTAIGLRARSTSGRHMRRTVWAPIHVWDPGGRHCIWQSICYCSYTTSTSRSPRPSTS